MAEIEQKRILTIDVSQSLRSLRDLRLALEKNKSELDKMTGSEENYEEQLVKTKKLQSDYNAQLRLTVKESKQVEGSYNALTVQLAKLKQQWKATGDAAERARLTKQINDVKGKLVEMDHSIGNWQRNVGNYQSAFDGLKAVFAKVGVAVGALAGVWKLFQNTMSQTQSTGDQLRNTMDATKSSYEALMTAVASSDWSAFSGGFWAVYDAAKAAAEAIDQLQNTQLAFDYLTQVNTTNFNAQYNIWKDPKSTEAQKAAAREQMQAIIDAQYEYAGRYNVQALNAYKKKVIKEAGSANLDIANVTVEQFRKAMEIDVSLDPAKARAENERQYREYLRKLQEYGKNNIAAQAKLKRQYADVIAIHAMLELMKDDELKGLSDILTGMERARQSAQQMERRTLRVETTATNADNKRTEAVVSNAKKRENALDAETDALIASINAEAQAGIDSGFKSEAAANRARAGRNAATLGRVDAWANNASVGARASIDDERTLQATLYSIREQADRKKLELLRRFAQEAKEAQDLQGQLDYEQQAADLSVQITQREMEEKARLRRQDEADVRRTVTSLERATSSTLGNIASAYQANIELRKQAGEISEKQAEEEFKRVKALQIAQTWIDALAGSVAIWTAKPAEPWYVRAAESAAILAQGVAATAQIRATQRGSATSNAFNAVQGAPVVLNAPGQVRTVTSASDEARLNDRAGAQKVVLLWSDVQAMGKKVAVTNAESQF